MRHTGIPIIGDVPWGTHFCQFYQSKQDLNEILVPYFKAGLENDEACFWVTSAPLGAEEAKAALASEVPNLDRLIQAGQFEILDHSQWHTQGGKSDFDRVLKAWVDRLETATSRGFSGLRLAGNTFYLEKADWDGFTEYEAAVDAAFGRYHMLAICTYSLTRCSAIEIMDVVSNHSFALIKRGSKWQIIESAERKKTEQALRESEAQLNALYESMTEGLAVHDVVYSGRQAVDYIVTDVNPAFERILNIRRETAIGRTATELYGSAAYLDVYAEVAEGGPPHSFETYFPPMAKHFSISVFSPGRGKFATVFSDITARKQAETALQAERDRLAALINSITDEIWFADADKRVTLVNPAVWKEFGTEIGNAEEIEGIAAGFAVYREDDTTRPADEAPPLRALRGETVSNEVELVRTPVSGEIRCRQVSAAPVRDRDGNIIGSVSVVRDITELKRAEEALRESERRFRALVMASSDVVYRVSPDWSEMRYLRGQDFIADTEEPTRTWLQQYIHVEDQTDVIAAIHEAIRTKSVFELVHRIIRVDGSLGWAFSRAIPILGADGEIIEWFGTVKDITNRKEAEEALRQSYLDQDRAQAVGQIGSWRLDTRRNILTWSEENHRIFGVPVGTPLTYETFLGIVHPDDRQDVDAQWNAGLRGEPYDIEHRLLVDGHVKWVREKAYLEFDEAGTLLGGFGITQDITDRKLAEEALRWAAGANGLLSEAAARLLRPGDLQQQVEEICRRAMVFLDCHTFFNFVVDEQTDRLHLNACAGVSEQAVRQMEWLDYGSSICGCAARDLERIIAEDILSTPDPRTELLKSFNVQASCAHPLLVQGRLIGTLSFGTRSRPRFAAREIDVMAAVADLVATAMYRIGTERALRESEERLRMAQQAAGVGAFEWNLLTGINTWTPELEQMYGLEPGSFARTQPAWESLIHPEDRAAAQKRVQQAFVTGQPTDGEWRVIWPDRSVHWISGRWQVLKDSGGTPVRMIGVNIDVTERKEAEEKISHHIRILEGINRILGETMVVDTEEGLGRKCLAIAEQVTESKFGFIGEVNAEGRLDDIAVSDPGWAACNILQSTGSGKVPASLEIRGIYGRVVLDGRGLFTNDPAAHPDRIGTPEGHPPLTAFLGVPLKHEGKTIGMIAVANREGGYRPQDQECLEALAVAIVQVLMRKRAERAVREAEDRLRQAQKMESIGVLAGGIAHDFNNLLTSILGNASLLQMDGASDSSEQLTSIIESSEKAAALTRQLLAYAGKGELQIVDFDVSKLVRSLGVLLRVSIPKDVEVKLAVPRTMPAVRGDSSQIQQVIMNLVINAAESTEGRKGGSIMVSARVRDLTAAAAERIRGGLAPGRYVAIAVKDNGCGMDQQTKARIFEPFFTTKFTGRGLGLAAVDGILRTHKGAITVDSVAGKGSQFTVYLPASGAPAYEPDETSEVPKSARALTVLVVDDEEAVRGFTQSAIERLGYKVLLASNGREALELLKNYDEVDLVLLDIVMPVAGGVEAFKEIRESRPDVGILIASGYNRQEARRLGIPDDLPFLEKPYTVQRLAAAIEQACKRLLT